MGLRGVGQWDTVGWSNPSQSCQQGARPQQLMPILHLSAEGSAQPVAMGTVQGGAGRAQQGVGSVPGKGLPGKCNLIA